MPLVSERELIWREKIPVNAMMRRHTPYADPRINAYLHTEPKATHRLQYEMGMDNYTGKSDLIRTQDERISHPSNMESHWPMGHDGSQMLNRVSSHPSRDDRGRNERRPYHQSYVPNPNTDFENQADREAVQAEQDMEIGYEETPSPLTFEGLERKFNDEIVSLVKEQNDLEDAEITRHKERLMEINTQYQQQLSSLRTRQGARREEFLQKESEARRYQFQKSGIQEYPNSMSLGDFHQYGRTGSVAASAPLGGGVDQYIPSVASAEATRPYGGSAGQNHFSPHAAGEATRDYRDPVRVQFESYSGERDYRGNVKTEDGAGRIPYPEGRVYNRSSRYH
uniref:Uncharacterized protein n=1 Tax=Kalanchoe fedtschenkoi TaxID=63787 RepID=A0A7N0RCN3_KALFE